MVARLRWDLAMNPHYTAGVSQHIPSVNAPLLRTYRRVPSKLSRLSGAIESSSSSEWRLDLRVTVMFARRDGRARPYPSEGDGDVMAGEWLVGYDEAQSKRSTALRDRRVESEE